MGFFILSLFITSAFAAIGPIATLNIVNDNVSPDGFTRAYVYCTGLSLTIEAHYYQRCSRRWHLSWSTHTGIQGLLHILRSAMLSPAHFC